MGSQVTAVRTPITAQQVAAMMASLWSSTVGGAPTQEALAVLTTQIDVETGWNSAWCWNVGNLVPSGGSDYCVVSGITLRAFTSLQDGVTAFLKLLKGRYSAALASAAIGDLTGYATNLKAQGYYGAPVTGPNGYLTLLQARYPRDAAAIGVSPSTQPAVAAPSSIWSTLALTVAGGLALGGAAFYLAERAPAFRPVRRRRYA